MEIVPLKVFIIYAHEDRAYKDDLLKSLKLLRKQGLVEAWHDRDLLAGDDWEKVILGHLQNAHLILPIISTDFFNSDFIEQVEIVEAFQRYEKGEAHILPIIARSCRWTDDPHISKLQALPEDGRPIARWESRDDAFEAIYDGIKAKIKQIHEARRVASEIAIRAQYLPEMVFIKGGTFQMGDTFNEGGKHEKFVHSVTVSDFYMGKYAVTFEDYDRFCNETKREKPSDEGWGRARRPVINVSWEDGRTYCQWLSEKTGLEFRLPTEAEWEYAAREGGKKVRFANGKSVANPAEINFNSKPTFGKPAYYTHGENRGKTLPVGTLNCPNLLGLHDLSGNVWEWCADWYGDYVASAQTNPTGPKDGSHRVLRGGSWREDPTLCCTASRHRHAPMHGYSYIGFRLAKTI